jgi:hypothetical protein
MVGDGDGAAPPPRRRGALTAACRRRWPSRSTRTRVDRRPLEHPHVPIDRRTSMRRPIRASPSPFAGHLERRDVPVGTRKSLRRSVGTSGGSDDSWGRHRAVSPSRLEPVGTFHQDPAAFATSRGTSARRTAATRPSSRQSGSRSRPHRASPRWPAGTARSGIPGNPRSVVALEGPVLSCPLAR